MTIKRVEGIRYGVEDMPECIEFLEHWGLEKLESGETGAEFKTPENQTISLRLKTDPVLPPTNEDGPTAREIAWGVDTKEALSQLGSELATDREVTDNGSEGLQTQDDSGNYFALRLADIKEDHQPEPQMNFHERITRTNERHWPDEKVRPLRIGHVVYSLPEEGNWEAAQFYMDRLNFLLSDRSTDGGTFMRCDGSKFHHTLFLFHRQGTHRYFNHVAFELNSFDQMMFGGTHMQAHGAVSVSGPGRHSLGSNWFWYFNNPCGGDIEYFADMDRLDENWQPGFWDESPPYARWLLGDDVLTG